MVFQIEFEVMPPPGSAPPSTTSAGTAPPGTGTGAAISTSASFVPGSQALAAPIQQPVISGPLGAVSGGESTTTNVYTSSIVYPVFTTTDTTALATVLSSGVLPLVQLADLQNKCAVLSFDLRNEFGSCYILVRDVSTAVWFTALLRGV